ncbi:hypothetical protein MMT18_28470, partial [Escherichia coli]|nr:hypothetical protein [Escherichia coli]
FGNSSKRQKRAQNVSDGLNQPKHIKPLPDAKNRVRKRLSAFLALAAIAKPSPWSVDARNAQEFCSASPVPNQ